MTKICIMTSVHPHNDVRIYHKQAKTLKDAGYDVTVICSNFEGVDENGIRFIKIDIPKERMKRIRVAPKLFFKKALELDCDFYHFHDPELIKAGIKLAKTKKVIYDVHEDVPRQLLTKPYLKPIIARPFSYFYEKYEQSAVKKIYAVITATPFITNRLKKFNSNTITVCNYPKLQEFEQITVDYQMKTNSVCYVGGITKIRGIFEIINAIDGCNAKLLLAGEFETMQLFDEVTALNGYKNTDFVGFVGREEIRDILMTSKAGLVTLHNTPSYRDSIPVKMFEYMVAGVPVIASDFPYWKEIMDDAKCGICVDPLDPIAIRNAIEFILNNPDKAQKMGENGRNKVLCEYNWDIEKQKLLQLYSI